MHVHRTFFCLIGPLQLEPQEKALPEEPAGLHKSNLRCFRFP